MLAAIFKLLIAEDKTEDISLISISELPCLVKALLYAFSNFLEGVLLVGKHISYNSFGLF